MKVLHLLKTGVGAAWAVRQIAVLREHGVDVSVVTPADRGEQVDQLRALGAEVITAEVDFPARAPLRLPLVMRTLRGIVQETRPDLIHSHFVGTTYVMRLALGAHHSIPRIFQVPGPLHLEKGPYGRIDTLLAGPHDYWVASCEWTRQRYLSLGVTKERVFRSFYGTVTAALQPRTGGKLRAELNLGAEVPIMGMVAYMYRPKRYLGHRVGLKGHEDFIRAVALVRQHEPRIKGVIVGGPWGNAHKYERALHRLAKREAGDAIVFTGFRRDVPELYADMDVALHPSLSENLGGAAESLAAGVPSIATEVGGFPDVIQDGVTGWLVPPGRPDRLAHAVLQVLARPQVARERALAGQRFVQQHLDVRTTGREVVEIYQQILGSEPTRALRQPARV